MDEIFSRQGGDEPDFAAVPDVEVGKTGRSLARNDFGFRGEVGMGAVRRDVHQGRVAGRRHRRGAFGFDVVDVNVPGLDKKDSGPIGVDTAGEHFAPGAGGDFQRLFPVHPRVEVAAAGEENGRCVLRGAGEQRFRRSGNLSRQH